MRIDMFRNISCVSTGVSRLLQWDVADGFTVFKCRVYGTREGQEWVLIQDNITDNFVYLEDEPASTFDFYRLEGLSTSGDTCVIDNIPATYIGKQAQRLVQEIRRRENILYRSQPFGAPVATVYMRKRFGERCHVCNYDCPTSGENQFCPSCYGTGIVGGYYKYPKQIRVLMSTPHAPSQQGTEANQVMAPVQTFRTTFGGLLRDHDILRVGSELYDVVKSTTSASIANVPVVYMLTTVQILPKEARYKTLWKIVGKDE